MREDVCDYLTPFRKVAEVPCDIPSKVDTESRIAAPGECLMI